MQKKKLLIVIGVFPKITEISTSGRVVGEEEKWLPGVISVREEGFTNAVIATKLASLR